MRSRRFGTALLCGCLLALPATGGGQENDRRRRSKDVDGDKLPPGEFTGKLVSRPRHRRLLHGERRNRPASSRSPTQAKQATSATAADRAAPDGRRQRPQPQGIQPARAAAWRDEVQKVQVEQLKPKRQAREGVQGDRFPHGRRREGADAGPADEVRRQGQPHGVHQGGAERAERQGRRPARLRNHARRPQDGRHGQGHAVHAEARQEGRQGHDESGPRREEGQRGDDDPHPRRRRRRQRQGGQEEGRVSLSSIPARSRVAYCRATAWGRAMFSHCGGRRSATCRRCKRAATGRGPDSSSRGRAASGRAPPFP